MSFKLSKSVAYTLKAGGIAALILLMLIPQAFVAETIEGRDYYKQEAVSKITGSWGGYVLATPPVLFVPYNVKEIVTNDKGKKEIVEKTLYAKYFPSELDARIETKTQIRYIGIFNVPVFTADITISGAFDQIALVEGARLSEAFIEIGVVDIKSYSQFDLLWNDRGLSVEAKTTRAALKGFECVYSYDCSSLFASTDINKNSPNSFKIKAKVKGSNAISFAPLAGVNKINIVSDWRDPSFTGSYLPDEKIVGNDGFDATWNITNVVSNPSESSRLLAYFISPINDYRNAERATKYCILFIVLTFALFFAFEAASKKPIHLIQYLLVGFAMVIFYLLLVSISEFIDFAFAYLIAAFATIALITSYIKFGALKYLNAKQVGGVALSFVFLYGFLYVLLQLEDMALLYGSIVVFIALAIIMYITRNIGWYDEKN
ncbi:MAG: cell envelope integrity protein CreD [Helicobacteraceae bacterium]|jgi:inner membrane protein|nr:cell envelope integrity protein CreD [Helicobacteraceae bacterium]